MPSPTQQSLLLAVLHVLALGACAAVVLGAAPAGQRAARGAWLAAAAGVAAAIMVWVAPGSLPVQWLAPLQEGTSDTALRLARGEGGHAGWVFDRFLLGAVVGEQRRLDALVVFHLAAAAAATIGLTGLLVAVDGRPGVVGALTAAWLWAVPVRWAAWSEGPAPVLWWYLLVLAALLGGVRGRGGAWRGVAAVGGLAGCVLLVGVRPELALLPAGALGAWGAVATGLAARADALLRRVAASVGRSVQTRPVWAGVGACACGLAVWGGYEHLLPGHVAHGTASWVISALHPLDPSPLAWPPLLGATWPPGFVALVLAGIAVSLRHPTRGCGVGLALFLLLRLYHSAAHGGFLGRRGDVAVFEVVRYLGFVAPALVAVAWIGLVAIEGRWPAVARGLLVACLLPPVPAAARLWPRSTAAREGAAPFGLFAPPSRDLQLEVRTLVGLLRAHGDCGFAVRTRATPPGWTVFPGPDAGAPRHARGAVEVASFVEAWQRVPDAACLIVVHGHAAALAGGVVDLANAPEVARAAHVGPSYAHPAHGWSVDGAVPVVAWRLERPAAAPPPGLTGSGR